MKRKHTFANQKRRDFLSLMARAGVSAPLIKGSAIGAGLLSARASYGATGVQRVIFVYATNGVPGGASTSFTPDNGMQMKVCSQPFEAVKDNCIFFKDTAIMHGDSPSGGHGLVHRVLGGYNAAKTIDLALADSVGAASPISAIHASVSGSVGASISSINQRAVGLYSDNPFTVFNKAFGANVDTSGLGTKQRKKLLDTQRETLKALQSRLSQFEKERLDEHLTAINRLEEEIDLAAAQALPEFCKTPEWNTENFEGAINDDNFTPIFDLQADTITLAMRCNLTNIGSIQMGNNGGAFSVTGLPGSHHGEVHSQQFDGYAAYCAYFSERVASLIQKLKDAKDLEGNSLLDSTVVVFVNDMGDGNSHTGTDAAYMMAGGQNLIRTGNVLNGQSNLHIFDTVAEAMGVGGQIQDYSDTGPLTGVLT